MTVQEIGWVGNCPTCGNQMGLQLEAKNTVVNGMTPNASRLQEMYEITAYCMECDKWVEPSALRPKA